MTTTGSTTIAGWYPDPTAPDRIRYWNGTVWTEHSLQAPPKQGRQATPTWSAPPPNGSERPKRPWWRRWWAIAIAVLAVLMLIGAFAPDSNPKDKAAPAGPPSPSASNQVSNAKPSNDSPPLRATVPALTGMSLAQARQELRASHLRAGYIERRPSAVLAGTVLSQGLRTGKQTPLRAAVPLVIAVALPRVPAVVGQNGAAAAQVLRNAGFQVRTVQKTVSSGTTGAVLSESPSSGRSVRPHALITIVVAHVVRPVVAAPPTQPAANCTPGYSPCLTPAYDYDCAGGSGDGPKYVYGTVRVTGSDPYGLDADGDGYGCD
jgi:resuscitation-promoting factor RpfB